jgi:CheY-like chemotaxis protein
VTTQDRGTETVRRELTFRLLGDQPHVGARDPLGFDQMAEDLAQLVFGSARSTPFTLGIEASWGAGKSSLMRRLEERVRAHPDVSTVWFNAWTAQEGEVLEGLIKTVLDEMDPNVLRRALRNKRVGKGLRIAGRAAAGLLRMDKVVDEIWEKVSVDPRARNEMRQLMEEAMEDWIGKRPEAGPGRMLVVFVDDLDRCSPENVFQVFEAMKLYLDASGFVFIVGYDRNIISDAILHEKKYGEATKSQDYIEKIVQIVHRIGPPSENQAKALLNAYTEASLTTKYFEDSARPVVIERNARNPRRIKRFINGFILEYGLDPEWERFGPVTLIHVLILYMYFPDFARLMNDRSHHDPVGEFLEYRAVRDMLRLLPRTAEEAPQDPRDPELVKKVFGDHGLAVHLPMTSGALDGLEAELPEMYPALAQNDGFVEVLRSLGDAESRRELIEKVQRRRPAPIVTGPGPASEAEPSPSRGEPLPIRILWLNDDPESDLELVASIEGRGATVARARDLEEARAQLQRTSFDVVVSDVTRDGNPNAGFEDLPLLRSETEYAGPIIFYTLRITPSRRKQADDLDTLMTADPVELQGMLEAVVRAGLTAGSKRFERSPVDKVSA